MSIEIMFEVEGCKDVQSVAVPKGSTGGELVAIVAAKGGIDGTGAFLFVEDGEEPIDLDVLIVDESAGRRVHHLHRAPHVDVTVLYNGGAQHRRFRPSARIQRVLQWAVGPDGFKIDPAIAPEMELALHGTTTALPKSAHLGRFVKHPGHKVEFDIIRGVVPNGAAP